MPAGINLSPSGARPISDKPTNAELNNACHEAVNELLAALPDSIRETLRELDNRKGVLQGMFYRGATYGADATRAIYNSGQ